MKYPKTDKTIISRDAHRGNYDQEKIFKIIDDAFYCVISYSREKQSFAIPTGHVRMDDQIFIHGSTKSHFLNQLTAETPVCISVSILDGLVLAKSALNQSFNYRSVNIFSKPEFIKEESEKIEILKAFTEKMVPGRWEDIRKPNSSELKATQVTSFKIKEVSAKIRSGPPKEQSSDRERPIWSGVIPLRKGFESPKEYIPSTNSIMLPEYLEE